MKTRIITAALALPLLIASILLPAFYKPAEWMFVIIAAAVLAAGLFEFYSLSKKLQLKADAAVGYLGAAALFVGFVFDAPATAPDLLLATLALIFMVLLVSQMFRFKADFSKMLAGTGVTFLGIIYIAFLGGYIVATRVGFEQRPGLSTDLLSFFFLVSFGADAGAYFVGRAIGKHKLAPAISPGKTVEGLIGGILSSAILAAVATYWFFPELPYLWSIVLASVLALAGALGDLAESAMKRGSNTKDTASTLPGHGGFLDRLDSLLFGAPIMYYFARYYFAY